MFALYHFTLNRTSSLTDCAAALAWSGRWLGLGRLIELLL